MAYLATGSLAAAAVGAFEFGLGEVDDGETDIHARCLIALQILAVEGLRRSPINKSPGLPLTGTDDRARGLRVLELQLPTHFEYHSPSDFLRRFFDCSVDDNVRRTRIRVLVDQAGPHGHGLTFRQLDGLFQLLNGGNVMYFATLKHVSRNGAGRSAGWTMIGRCNAVLRLAIWTSDFCQGDRC